MPIPASDIIHDFSNKKPAVEKVKCKKETDIISVKSFANKSLSRSNSFEKEKLCAPKLPKTKQPVNSQKYKVIRGDVRVASKNSDIRSHDNNQTDASEQFTMGFYNQIVDDNKDDDDKLKLPLIPRERVVSLCNIDKDALDDYLYSGSNSQEPEAEIMQYFQNGDPVNLDKVEVKLSEDPLEKNDKISQLRLLLEKNLKTNKDEMEQVFQADAAQKSLILSSLLSSGSGLNTKGKVSFDTHNTDSVPPSPNTRRKNFSFTPISPGPNSPGTKSKNSSTNASPFVSPRSTPIPLSNKYVRNRTTITQNSTNRIKQPQRIKTEEHKLSIDISKAGEFVIPNDRKALPMSAPPSPMLLHRQQTSNQTYLHNLLDNDLWSGSNYVQSDNKNIDEYINKKLQMDKNISKLKIDFKEDKRIDKDEKIHSADLLSREVSQFFPDEGYNNSVFRSQSVPLHQMKPVEENVLSPANPYYNPPVNYNYVSNVTSTCSSVGQTPVPNEFSDFTSLNELNNENLDKIFHILQNDSNQLLVNNQSDINLLQTFPTEINSDPSNVLMRSQSIDFTINQNVKYPPHFPPSRSVPSTPLPFQKEKLILNPSTYDSKSYPTTPLINETGFNYKMGDYLLNGQPIRKHQYDPSFIKKNVLNETSFVDEFAYAADNNSLLNPSDRSLMEFNYTRDNTCTDASDLLQLGDNTPDTSDNFVTSTNNEQQIFYKTDNINNTDVGKFVAGSTKLT